MFLIPLLPAAKNYFLCAASKDIVSLLGQLFVRPAQVFERRSHTKILLSKFRRITAHVNTLYEKTSKQRRWNKAIYLIASDSSMRFRLHLRDSHQIKMHKQPVAMNFLLKSRVRCLTALGGNVPPTVSPQSGAIIIDWRRTFFHSNALLPQIFRLFCCLSNINLHSERIILLMATALYLAGCVPPISFLLAFSNWSHRARSEIVSCRGGASVPRARTMPRSRFAGEKKLATEIAGLGIRRCSVSQQKRLPPVLHLFFTRAHELVCVCACPAPTSLNINRNQTVTRAADVELCRPLQIALVCRTRNQRRSLKSVIFTLWSWARFWVRSRTHRLWKT